jgi:hypothetical protein
MSAIGTAMVTTFDYVWERHLERIASLDDDEFGWEPVPECWSIRADAEGHGRIDGAGTLPPEPAPFTTIAWRIGHIGVAVGGFADQLFGEGQMTVADMDFPVHASGVAAFYQGHYSAWRDGMVGLDDERWWSQLGPTWGPYAESNHVDLALHVFDEVVHHAAEVALLRDLYARRSELG